MAAGCANRGGIGPPGGPVDTAAPRVIRVTPDSGATSQRPGAIQFQFNKIVSDNPGRGSLAQYFLISPFDGRTPRVNWHRDHIDVRPRRGFRQNTAYTVTLLPGLADVRGNQMKEGAVTVFSTGSALPRFGIVGTIFDWAAERPAGGALVEAISRPDSVVYLAVADSLGQYNVGPFGPGRYTLLGFVDRNDNRALDPPEIWDSTTVLITTSRPVIELLAVTRDTIPPRMSAIAKDDSMTLRVTFDRPLDPAMPLTPALFRLQRADSGEVTIASVIGAHAAADSAARRDSTRRDSITRRDTTRRDSITRRDTTTRRDTSAARAAAPPGAPPSIVPIPAPTPRPTPPPPAPRPSAPSALAPPPPRPSRPGPDMALLIRISAPQLLEPGVTYRVTARGVRSVVGRSATSSRTVTMPRVPLPTAKDSARARDTTRTPPPRKPPDVR
jgi:hypothetical protein